MYRSCVGCVHHSSSTQRAKMPGYLTQDLIWLSVCLYAHIAECNHDHKSRQMLLEFHDFIKRQAKELHGPTADPNSVSQPCPASDNIADSIALEWPMKRVNRTCLLTAFQDTRSLKQGTAFEFV